MGKTIAIIQARMGSSRLPGKVLLDLGGQSMLARVLNRASRTSGLDSLVVATTHDKGDDVLQEFCEQAGFACFRGDPYDVLDRYYRCARMVEAETVVRITADCPFIAPEEIARVLEVYQKGDYDFVANRLPPPFKRTTPIGMDTEVVSFANLEQAWQEAKEPYEREHVMPYFYDTVGRFKVKLVQRCPSLGNLRFTVDTPEDLALARQIYAAFENRDDFTLAELLATNAQHPEWQASVSAIKHKGFKDLDARMPGGKEGAHV
jgi:spore coat polysaccharide biosynthesis protein SpsF